MSKLFSTLIFFLFLLFQTASLAEENSTSPQTNIEGSEEGTEEEPKETLSEAEKEARDAEAAELREAGVDEVLYTH